MRRILTVASCFVLACAMTTVASADVVSDFWDNVLADPDIDVGDTIRVVFVTAAAIDGTGPAMNKNKYFDDFGDTQALAGVVTGTFAKGTIGSLQPLDIDDWRPLVSTTDDAVGSIGVRNWLDFNGDKVFNTSGQLVADNGTAMHDGTGSITMGNSVQFSQSADDMAPNGSVGMWTGTDSTGAAHGSIGSGVDVRLGSGPAVGLVPHSIIGDGAATDGTWLDFAASPRQIPLLEGGGNAQIDRSIYVMSGEITVVPEPSTILMWLGFTGVAGLVYWRKRR